MHSSFETNAGQACGKIEKTGLGLGAIFMLLISRLPLRCWRSLDVALVVEGRGHCGQCTGDGQERKLHLG